MKLKSYAPLLSEKAYERILQAFVDSTVSMGSRISQKDLVELTGIPIGPVRDALKVLEADGLVKINPRSGIELIAPSAELIRATIQFRTMIEKPAARRFALTAPADQIDQLIELHSNISSEIAAMPSQENAYEKLSELELKFHTALVNSLGNELVEASYKRLQLMGKIIRGKAVFNPKVALFSVNEHLEVLTACKDRNPEAAEDAISNHLSNALARNLGVI